MDKIPEMKIEEGKIIEETMSLDIVVNGKTEQVVMKKLTSGEQGKIRSACVKTKYLAGQPHVDINDVEFEQQLLQASIVSAPFPHDLMGIKNLPEEVFRYLSNEWANFVSFTPEKKD